MPLRGMFPSMRSILKLNKSIAGRGDTRIRGYDTGEKRQFFHGVITRFNRVIHTRPFPCKTAPTLSFRLYAGIFSANAAILSPPFKW